MDQSPVPDPAQRRRALIVLALLGVAVLVPPAIVLAVLMQGKRGVYWAAYHLVQPFRAVGTRTKTVVDLSQ